MLAVALIALSGCGGDGGTTLTSTHAARASQSAPAAVASRREALPEQRWEGMPCRNSAVITYGGCGAVP